MNSTQIVRAIRQNPITNKKFCEVFSTDRLAESFERNQCGFAANTNPSSKSGTHWVAFYFASEHKKEFVIAMGKRLIIIKIHLKTI